MGEVAEVLGYSVSTVKRIPREDLPYSESPGGQRRYEKSDVAAYLREQGRAVPVELLT